MSLSLSLSLQWCFASRQTTSPQEHVWYCCLRGDALKPWHIISYVRVRHSCQPPHFTLTASYPECQNNSISSHSMDVRTGPLTSPSHEVLEVVGIPPLFYHLKSSEGSHRHSWNPGVVRGSPSCKATMFLMITLLWFVKIPSHYETFFWQVFLTLVKCRWSVIGLE